MTFPQDFVFGAATAAYQIEGGAHADGRGESIWDRFCSTPGMVRNGDSGDEACNHYFRWREDLDLMRSLGLRGYRFSISWTRIQPDGRGPANRKGIDFYRRLVEGLLEREIAPLATVYHWDLPQALQDQGGWTSREIVDRFVDYAELLFDELGDLVNHWVSHNEPWVTAFLGYGVGSKAPGIRDWPAALIAAHHTLLAHGRTVASLRRRDGAARIGITLNLTQVYGDAEPARRMDGYNNRWFLDPVLRGCYPADMVELYEKRLGPLDFVRDGDLAEIAEPIDFLGINFYRPTVARLQEENGPAGTGAMPDEDPVTAMGWTVQPQALQELLMRLKHDYGDMPILITENGAAYDDRLVGDVIDDPGRVEYLRGHLAAVERALGAGVDVRGYYVWSLLDNFEWEHGYSKRFGIVYVDYPTQRRLPKQSALWYRDLIAQQTNGRHS
jgi:beta-glucosidase